MSPEPKECPAGDEPAGPRAEASQIEAPSYSSAGTQDKAENDLPELGKPFPTLFANPDATGYYTANPGPEPAPGEKRKTKYEYVAGQPTLSDWIAHLEGKVGLLAVPVRADGTCTFGVIDIDDYST